MRGFNRKGARGREVQQIWYTKTDLCNYLGITYTTFYRWVRHKNFPEPEMFHLCRTGRYDIRKIEAFLTHKS
ncbi:helix-turn-helix domain-containing protein [Shewanella sp. 202IG2-18]|nr:helix-turn-helix domain-containing protein [Parashewanella hymeniacidonis]